MNVDEYIDGQEPFVRQILKNIRAIVYECAPGAEEGISYGMPAYKIGGKALLYFGAFKKHLGFYPSAEAVEAFAIELQGYKVSKGAIQFPYKIPMPYDLIKRIVEYRVKAEI